MLTAAVGTAAERPHPFASMEQVFDAPRGAFFGVDAAGVALNTNTFYRATTPGLIFDVGNNQIFCSVNRQGLIRSAAVLDNDGKFYGSSPWPFALDVGSGICRLDLLPAVTCDLLGNYIPLFTFSIGSIRVRELVFAPVATQPGSIRPRAIIVCFRLDNLGDKEVSGTFQTPPGLIDVNQKPYCSYAVPEDKCPPRWPEQNTAKGRFGPGYEAIACLDDTYWSPQRPVISFSLKPGSTKVLSFACFFTGQPMEILEAKHELSERPVIDWLNQTWGAYAERLGQLRIPAEPYWQEAFERLAIEAYHSVLISPDGHRATADGGLMLIALIAPDTLRDFIKGSPAGLISAEAGHSLYNSYLGAPAASALYYQMTGDTQFFAANPNLLESITNVFQDTLSYSKRSVPMLLYAQQMWDSLARGDWHTGSNMLVWYVLKYWALIARDGYHNEPSSRTLAEYSEQMHADIDKYLVGNGPLGPQFYEGANLDGTFVRGHDGEEGVSTLAPFLGFCRADDTRLLNYKQQAFSTNNPLYHPGLDAVDWLDCHQHDQPWSGYRCGPTAPAWAAALAGADSEAGVHQRLRQIGRLLDLDGSIWWWPYALTNVSNLADVRRRDGDADVGKTAYAAALLGIEFYNKVLGLSFDYPSRSIRWAPLSPWNDWSWEGCRFGNSSFDLFYSRNDSAINARLTNTNSDTFQYSIELLPLPGRTITGCLVNGVKVATQTSPLYGRRACLVNGSVGPGESVSVVASCRIIPESEKSQPTTNIVNETLRLPPSDLQWWRDAKFGLFIHWGLFSLVGQGEWRLFQDQRDYEDYKGLARSFKAERFDASTWARTAKSAGMKYMVMVTRHHDGFALWDSPASYEQFDSIHSAAHRDFVAEYIAACRVEGLRVGVYYSPLDWRFPGFFFPGMYRRNAEEMREQTYGQVRELMSRYGKIDILWYDGGDDRWLGLGGLEWNGDWRTRGFEKPYLGKPLWEPEKLNAMVRQLQPTIVINNRSGWEGDFFSREKALGDFDDRRPWEKCSTLADGWGILTNSTEPRSLKNILQELSNVVCRDGNLLLNVGPRADGEIVPAQVARLNEIGLWLKEYGQCIYGTRGGPMLPTEKFGTTQTEKAIYVHIWQWPMEGEIRLEGLRTPITNGSKLAGDDVKVMVDGDSVLIKRLGTPTDSPLNIVKLKK